MKSRNPTLHPATYGDETTPVQKAIQGDALEIIETIGLLLAPGSREALRAAGYKIIAREPTEAMCEAVMKQIDDDTWDTEPEDYCRAMWDAAS